MRRVRRPGKARLPDLPAQCLAAGEADLPGSRYLSASALYTPSVAAGSSYMATPIPREGVAGKSGCEEGRGGVPEGVRKVRVVGESAYRTCLG